MQSYLISNRSQRQVYGLSLFAAPLLLGTATFWWDNGVGITGGTLQVVSAVFWIVALLGMAELTRPQWPRSTAFLSVISIYAGIAVSNFGLAGAFIEAARTASGGAVSARDLQDPIGSSLLIMLFVPGLLFPVSIIAFGVLLWRRAAISAWCMVLLCAAGLSFPAGRIPRIEAIAHFTDVLLLVGLGLIGWSYLRAREP